MDNMRTGSFVKSLRKEKGMTQKELAERLHITDRAVSKWERGICAPDIGLMEPLADILGVGLTELISGERSPDGVDPITEEKVAEIVLASSRELKKKATRLILVIAALVAVLVFALHTSFTRISGLRQEIQSIHSDYEWKLSNLRQEIEDIYQNVDEQMREEASLLSGAEAVFGQVNTEDHTVEAALTVVPKEIAGDARLQVSLDGRTVELTREGSGFTGTIPVDLFTREEFFLLTITTETGVQTQYIRDIPLGGFWTHHLPSMYTNSMSVNGTFSDGIFRYSTVVDVQLASFPDWSDVKFESFRLVTTCNGEEIHSHDLTQELVEDDYGWRYHCVYEKEYTVQEGDELIFYVEGTDSLGYVHRVKGRHFIMWSGAEPWEEPWELIYDSEGNLLYEKQS